MAPPSKTVVMQSASAACAFSRKPDDGTTDAVTRAAGATDQYSILPMPGHFTAAATYDSTVDITPQAPRVLVIGLDPYRVPGPWEPKPVADAIEAGMVRFAEHGVGAESCLFGLDGSDDVEMVIAAALCARPWECVVIGGGVRKPDDQLELFERVVNLVRRHAPGAAIAFNATPSDTFDAAIRWIDIPG